MSIRFGYWQALSELARTPEGINLDVKLLEALTPHLPATKLLELLAGLTANSSIVIALPPLRINHGFHTLALLGESTTTGDDKERLMKWGRAHRLPESFTQLTQICARRPIDFSAEAIAFAQSNWGDDLVLDESASTIAFNLQDPTVRVGGGHGHPTQKLVVTATVKQALFGLHSTGRPRSQVIDEAILEVTTDPVVASELVGGRSTPMPTYHCYNCSRGLLLTECTGCGVRFQDNGMRAGVQWPLPAKVIAHLKDKGHTFTINPERAVADERKRFADEQQKLKDAAKLLA